MWATRDVGSLAVVERTSDRKRIEHELKQFDRNLFLDAEIDSRRRFVWSVKEWLGSERPPHLVFEWRDGRGEPLPLTSGLIEEVRKIEWRRNHGITVFDVVNEANDKRRSAAARASESAYEAITEEVVPLMSDKRSGVLPRSQALRISRDRERARGAKK